MDAKDKADLCNLIKETWKKASVLIVDAQIDYDQEVENDNQGMAPVDRRVEDISQQIHELETLLKNLREVHQGALALRTRH